MKWYFNLLLVLASVSADADVLPWFSTQHTLSRISDAYLEGKQIYKYPDAVGQSLEELLACYHKVHRGCGPQSDGSKSAMSTTEGQACDPDDDESPWAGHGNGYVPEDLAEMFLFPKGNVKNIKTPDIDLYIVNPYV